MILTRLLRPPLARYFHSTSSSWATRKTLQRFKLADIGEGITECEVIKWNVQNGMAIQSFDPLCEVQSDKASVEITSPFDGIVAEILIPEGSIAKVGEGLCLIEIEEEVDASEAPVLHETPPLAASVEEPQSSRRLHPLDPKFTPEASAADKVLATPSVRHLARSKGVDLAKLVPGSGRDGRIEKKDVEASLSSINRPQIASTTEDVIVELGRTRYGMWKAMIKSLEIPHFGYSTTLDLTVLHNLLPTLNLHIPSQFRLTALPAKPMLNAFSQSAPDPLHPGQQYDRLTYLPILLKALSKAMLEWPLFRSSITPIAQTSPTTKPTLTIRPHADISIALSTPYRFLSSKLRHLSYLGRQNPSGLTVAEMPKRGGTLTVSNVGAIGAGDFAAPVLVPGGGVAIVAIGRAKWIWDVDRGDGSGERRLKVGVSWSADHRVVEGAELAAFVECWRSYVEVPERLIAGGGLNTFEQLSELQ
ncbi:2-oxoacid dehydrogenases acyltransferase-domain-containing protein [Mycena floridula]|nr:2-oxoacid dehydrogenases acyltransferase-domain-containing protein [Mycena floridula]